MRGFGNNYLRGVVKLYILFFKFVICAGFILFAGMRIARYADIIAEKTGLGGLWIGLILVAVATSLPELFTGIGSVVFLDSPDLTVGNLIGANSYNLLNIALLDLLHKGAPLLSLISTGQLLTAAFSLIPIMILTVGIIVSGSGFSAWSAGNIGIFSMIIFVSYCVITKIMYNFERKRKKEKGRKTVKYPETSLKKAFMHYSIAAAIIIASGVWLAYIGKDISTILRLNESFVGSLFIGFVTTLPEITVSVAAIMIGAKEIAIANMFGSNLFNMTIVFIDDILYKKAPIFQDVSLMHIGMACTVMIMTAVIIIAIATRSRKKIFNISWYVPVLLVVFLLGAYLNFSMGLKQ